MGSFTERWLLLVGLLVTTRHVSSQGREVSMCRWKHQKFFGFAEFARRKGDALCRTETSGPESRGNSRAANSRGGAGPRLRSVSHALTPRRAEPAVNQLS